MRVSTSLKRAAAKRAAQERRRLADWVRVLIEDAVDTDIQRNGRGVVTSGAGEKRRANLDAAP